MRTQGANLILLFSIWEKVLLAGQSYREGRKEAGKQGKEVVTGEADVGEYNISKLQQTPLNQQKLNHCSRDLHLPPNMLSFSLSSFSTCRQRIHGGKIHSSLCKLGFQPPPWPCTLQAAASVESLHCYDIDHASSEC